MPSSQRLVIIVLAGLTLLTLAALGALFVASQNNAPLKPTVMVLAQESSSTPTPAVSPTPTSTSSPMASPVLAATTTATLLPPSETPTVFIPPTATVVPTATITPSPTLSPTPAPDAVVVPKNGVTIRNGPGLIYMPLGKLRFGTTMDVLKRNQDNSWLQVHTKDIDGWVSAQYLKVYADLTKVPAASAEEIAAIPTTKGCVDVVGDSVAHGGAVFEIPLTGYARAPLAPVSKFIEDTYKQMGVNDLKGIDRSVSATGISAKNYPSYFDTSVYQDLLKDRCRFTIVLPWINDLSGDGDPAQAVPDHVAALVKLANSVVEKNPDGRVLILNYYFGAPTQFALTGFAKGFTPTNITQFNQAINESCQNGDLSKLKQVSCYDIGAAFASLGASYVVGPTTLQQLQTDLISEINKDEMALVNYYFGQHPDGQLVGDGVHLSTVGKTALAVYLVNIMRTLPDVRPTS